jgi:hypothetical protein
MFDYFYHGTIRKAVVAFANMFNNMYIARYDSNQNEVERIKVPIAYGPRQKFIRRLERIGTDFDQAAVKLENYLPRLSFEMTNITYDSSRKLSAMNSTVVPLNATQARRRYERVPYNIEMTLSILAKNTEDALQIFEQIVPLFQPDYTVSINMNETDKDVDVPIVFKTAVLTEGDDGSYGDYGTRKITVMNLSFTMKLYLYGPIKTVGIIRSSQVNFAASRGSTGGITAAYGPSGSNIRIVASAVTGATSYTPGATGQVVLTINPF